MISIINLADRWAHFALPILHFLLGVIFVGDRPYALEISTIKTPAAKVNKLWR